MNKILKCKDCKLYNSKDKVCTVVIISDGERFELPTLPNNECMWIKSGVDVHEIRVWSDGENGYVQTTDPNLDIKHAINETSN